MNKQSGKDAQASPDEKRRSEEVMRFARQRLALAGFTDDQLNEMERTGKADERLILKSPLSGTVLERNTLPGEVAEEGAALYTIADLSVLWVQILVLESDIAAIRKDMPVEITSVANPGHLLHGSVDFIAPTVIPEARAVKVRVVVPNTAGELRPGMFVNATLRSPLGRFEIIKDTDVKTTSTQPVKMIYTCPMDPEVISDKPADCPKCGMALVQKPAPVKDALWSEGWACSMHPDELSDQPGVCTICDCGMQKQRYRLEKQIAIPESAVIDTGQKQVVYVETSPGVYDAHSIVLGPRTASWYPVRDGLKPGDRIVTRGSFLIDAEARLNPEH
jgi:Cu(I)/Ag(I) efflux system membrane fusion protein